MATTTPNYGLRKPARADLVNVITDLNDNMDILDGVVLDNDNRPIVVPLDTVTNVSGSYTHTTTISTANLVTSRMKAIKLELADPSVFRDKIIVTVADDEVTLSCDDVVGTSDVTVTLMRVTPLASAEFHPPYMTSDEFDEMAARVGDLSDLDTTDKDCVVDAVNEVKGITDTLNSKFIIVEETMPSSANDYKTIALPTGLNAQNSALIGYSLRFSEDTWYSHYGLDSGEVTIFVNATNIRVKTTNSGFLGNPLKVIFIKY